MISLQNLNRQHLAIKEEVTILETEINRNKGLINVSDINYHIRKLTALFKIHLLEEDRFLYPELLSLQNDDVKKLANQYMIEMGDLVDEYTIFKCSYNMEERISNRIDDFISNAKIVIGALKQRITREENELYHMIKTNHLGF